MVRWYDGLYGGLAAGLAVVLFYAALGLVRPQDPGLAALFAQLSSAVVRTDAPLESNGWAVACGAGLHFLVAGGLGIVYALAAGRIRAMGRVPFSVVWGLGYGLLVWFTLNDVLVPLAGIVSAQPFWEAFVADTILYGVILSEFTSVVQRRRAGAA